MFELCSSEIKITYRLKSLVVIIWITTGRKATYTFLHAKTSYLKHKIEDARSLHGVRSVDTFLLSDIFQLSTEQKWTVCYSLFFIRKVNFL